MANDPENTEKTVKAQPNQSFRHLFSFGGADVKPVPKLVPRDVVPVAPPIRKRPREELREGQHATAGAVPVDELSDPEDVDDEVLSCARAFCRGERAAAAIHAEWFNGGRQERLRNDLKLAHKRNARGSRTMKSERPNGKR